MKGSFTTRTTASTTQRRSVSPPATRDRRPAAARAVEETSFAPTCLAAVHPDIKRYVRDVGTPILTPIFRLYVGKSPSPSAGPSGLFSQMASRRDCMSLPEFLKLFEDLNIDARQGINGSSSSAPSMRAFLSRVFRAVAVQCSRAAASTESKRARRRAVQHMSLRARIVHEYQAKLALKEQRRRSRRRSADGHQTRAGAGTRGTSSSPPRKTRSHAHVSSHGAVACQHEESDPTLLAFDGFCYAVCLIAQHSLDTGHSSSPIACCSRLIEFLKSAATTHLKMQPDHRAAVLSQIKIETPMPVVQAVSAKARGLRATTDKLGVKQSTTIPLGWKRASKYAHNTRRMAEVRELKQKSAAKKHESFERVSTIHGYLSEKNIAQLLRDTNYNRRELYVMYARFKALCALSATPYGIDKDTFKKGVARLSVEDDLFVGRVFALVDDDQSNCIEWPEFLKALSSLEKGSRENKTQFFFRIYDLDEDGYISKEDLSTMFLSSSMLTDDATARDLTDAFVDRVFKQLGVGASDKLSLEEVQRYLANEGANEDVWELFGRSMLKDFTSRRSQ